MRTVDRRISLAILLALAALVGYLSFLIAQPFIPDIFFAACLAIAFHPLYAWFDRRLRRPALSSFLTTLAILLVILVPMILMGMAAAGEGRALYEHLKRESAEDGGWSAYFAQYLDPPLQWIAAKTGMTLPDLRQAALDRIQSWSTKAVQWAGSLLGNLTETIADTFITLFTLYFLLQSSGRVGQAAREYLPLAPGRVDELMRAIGTSIVANVYGIAAVSAAQGLLTGVGFAIAGLHAPVLWGCVAAICALVPVVGAALVWVPGVIALVVVGSYGMAIFLVIWGVVVVGMADNVIRPLILSSAAEMSTLPVFFALLGGMQAFGMIGLFAGPVVLSVAMALIRMLHEERLALEGEVEAASG